MIGGARADPSLFDLQQIVKDITPLQIEVAGVRPLPLTACAACGRSLRNVIEVTEAPAYRVYDVRV